MEARICLERTSQIFELHYGVWHKTHQELVQKLAQIGKLEFLMVLIICTYSIY